MPVDVLKRMEPASWQKMPYFRQVTKCVCATRHTKPTHIKRDLHTRPVEIITRPAKENEHKYTYICTS